MCEFFSLVSDGKGKIMYFDWEIRKKILAKELNYALDSHTSIADYFGYKTEKEDTLNKYEYNPLTKILKIDQLNTVDDSVNVKKFCDNLDFKIIVPQLIAKTIVNPFDLPKVEKPTKSDIELLKQLVLTRYSVKEPVENSIWSSVENSIWSSLRNLVWNSVWDSVGASVWSSVRDSVSDSVGVSARDSVVAYIGSFFDIRYDIDISGSNKLWERGIVPSYNGKVWRLHSGKNADTIWKGELNYGK